MPAYLPHYKQPGETDWTDAFNRAVEAVQGVKGVVQAPAGPPYIFNRPPKPIPSGVTIVGEGSILSTDGGTRFVSAYAEAVPTTGFLVWDGSDVRQYQGPGGGIRDISIFKHQSYNGGCAIKLMASVGHYRTGDWTAQNVSISGEAMSGDGFGLWDRCLFADGLSLAGAGGDGLSNLSIVNLLANRARVCTVEFRNVVGLTWSGGKVSPGLGSVISGANKVKLTGQTSPEGRTRAACMVGLNIDGWLEFEHATEFTFFGRATGVVSFAASSKGFVTAVGVGNNWTNAGTDVAFSVK